MLPPNRNQGDEGDGFARPFSPEEVDASQRWMAQQMGFDYDELVPPAVRARQAAGSAHGVRPNPAGVTIRNFAAVEQLHDGQYVAYRRVLYLVKPFHVKWGHRLQVLHAEYLAQRELPVTRAALAEMLAIVGAMTRIFRRLARPVSRLHRWLLYPLQRGRFNPFGDPTEQEVFDLLGFFCSTQAMSSARLSPALESLLGRRRLT